jgi:hypothetical protein
MRAALVTLLVVCAPAARADFADGVVPELRLGAGYDDNLFLDANPQGPLATQRRSDAIFDVAPRVLSWVGLGAHTLYLDLDYLERLTLQSGELRDFNAKLGYRSSPLGPIRLRLLGLYEHYEATHYEDNTFDLGGGQLAIGAELGRIVRAEASYRADARVYSDPLRQGQRDTEQRAGLVLTARVTRWLSVEAGYGYLSVDSNNPAARLDRHRGELALALRPTRWLYLGASYALGGQWLPSAMTATGALVPRSDVIHWVEAAAVARPLAWLELYVRYDLVSSSSTEANGDYQRNQVVAGFTVLYELERRWHPTRPLEPTARGREITFRHRAAPGRHVSVVGDWNGWDASAAPLTETRAGFYEGTYSVPVGRREYAISVDGQVERPADAAAYVPDGFGGANGVVDVP